MENSKDPLRCAGDVRAMNLFIIPGNPPAIYFYELWKKEILSRHPKAKIQTSPYPCFELGNDSAAYLEKVCDFHAQAFLKFSESCQQPVTIIGHSVGGFVTHSILENHPTKIRKALLLFPYLMAPTLRGQNILKIMRGLQKFKYGQAALFAFKHGVEKIHSDLAKLSDSELAACVNLAYHEQVIPGKRNTPPVIRPELRAQMHFIYCKGDTWCPQSTIEALKTQIEYKESAASHGFITHKKERETVLRELEDWLLDP